MIDRITDLHQHVLVESNCGMHVCAASTYGDLGPAAGPTHGTHPKTGVTRGQAIDFYHKYSPPFSCFTAQVPRGLALRLVFYLNYLTLFI